MVIDIMRGQKKVHLYSKRRLALALPAKCGPFPYSVWFLFDRSVNASEKLTWDHLSLYVYGLLLLPLSAYVHDSGLPVVESRHIANATPDTYRSLELLRALERIRAIRGPAESKSPICQMMGRSAKIVIYVGLCLPSICCYLHFVLS